MTIELFYRGLTFIPGLMLGIVLHELGHAYFAYRAGDSTAKREGRMTLNPMAHIDILGTVIVPLICLMSGGLLFGWAKPVPIQPTYFKNFKKDYFLVAIAGSFANFLLSIAFLLLAGIVVYLMKVSPESGEYIGVIYDCAAAGVVVNVLLGVFNLLPIPSLDGFKICRLLINNRKANEVMDKLEANSLIFFVILYFSGILGYLLLPSSIISSFMLSFLRLI